MHLNNFKPPDGCLCLSIVIRTFNSGRTLGRLLARIAHFRQTEVIIVDSGSTDQTSRIVSDFGVKFVNLSTPFQYGKALNVGFFESSSSWILSISSHCIPVETDFVKNILRFTRSVPENCVVGYGQLNVVPPKVARPPVVGNLLAFERGKFLPGGNSLAVYRRSAWEAHPFSEDIDTAEDLEWFLWAMRHGYTARFIQGASAVYLNQGSLAHMYKKGWLEVRRARALVPDSSRNISSVICRLGLNYAYYTWLAIRLKISPATMFRHLAHSSGAFLAAFFPLSPQPLFKSEKIFR